MDTKTKQNEILIFIKNTFDDYSFDRLKDYNKYNDFGDQYKNMNYTQFINHNKDCINNLSYEKLSFVYLLMQNIKDKFINITDEENFIEWESESFYFNIENKLIITHPR
jgi:hypothetical protein